MATLKLSIIGFDIPETTFIKTTVELASGMDLGQWIIVDGEEEADTVLVNTDTLSCQAAISQYAASGHKKEGLFISCAKDCTQSSAITLSLKRPITYPALVSLLTELQVELRKSSGASIPTTVIKTEKRFNDAIPRPLPPPKASPSIIVNRILKDLPTQEFEMEQEAVLISEPTTEVEYLDSVAEESINISDLFKAAEISVLNDIVRPADREDEQVQSKTSTIKRSNPELKQSPIHSVEHFHSSHIGLMEGSERDLLLLDRPARRFYEATRFLGILKNSVQKNQATEITHYHFPMVRIYPDQKTYATPENIEFPVEMFRTLAVEFSNQKLTKMSEREAPIDWQIKPLWHLLFLATLYGSEGRLMEGTQLSDKLHLVSEPDYTIVPEKAEYEAITCAMKTHEAVTLKNIADKSGVRIETVIDFCNACEEAQLIKRLSFKKQDDSVNNNPSHHSALYKSADSLDEPENPSLVGRIKSIFKHS